MRLAYVLEDAGLSGGARIVLEHCTRLAARGHEVTLLTVTPSDPRGWFDFGGLEVKHIVAGSYTALERELRSYDGCKIATWWKTAPSVARSGGRGYYLVQDIETSYFPDAGEHAAVLATYDLPLRFVTVGHWVRKQLNGRNPEYVGIAIDHETFKPTGAERGRNTVLYNYRRHFLKGPGLMIDALDYVPRGTQVITFGQDRPPVIPSWVNHDHRGFLSDAQVADLYNQSAVFVLTSTHEGFGLPLLEAMACGCPVITTNADGNMEFCANGVNCIVVDRDPEQLADAIQAVCSDRDLAERLSCEGLKTAQRYRWNDVIDKLETAINKGD